MKSIEPPDVHHLRAALGWLDLGNDLEATRDLERISAELRVHPDVLEVRWQICARAKKWDACVVIARAIRRLDPNRYSGWLDLAYSLRRAAHAGLPAAWDALLPAAEKFPDEPLISFNLSCYACQLGRLEDACHWLRRAFAIAARTGAKKRLRLMALNQPDLEPLWRKIGQLIR
jgi:tetratricopeptide (TPR) repeat protein